MGFLCKKKIGIRENFQKKGDFLYSTNYPSLFNYLPIPRKNTGGLKKEYSPFLFAYGLIYLVMDIIFLYMEWKTYKES